MNCGECRDQLVPYVEGLLESAAAQAVEAHLAGCPTCRAEHQATSRLHNRLMTAGSVQGDTNLDHRVMDQIFREQVTQIRRLKMRKRFRVLAASGIAAALIVSLTWAALRHGPAKAAAAEILARGAQAAADLNSIYIKCRMRTLPADNFSYLAPEHEFVDVQLWKEYGDSPKWKIAKPGRVALMDGRQTVMVIDNRMGVKLDMAAPMAFDTGWLHRLAAVDRMLSSELAAITAAGYDVKTVHEPDSADAAQDQVTVEVDTKEQVGEYLKNKFLNEADTRRVYSFDPESGRLEGAKFYCRTDDKEVLVLEIVEIQYNPALNDSVFKLDVPESVVWYEEPQRLPDNEKYEKMTPREAARAMFEAFGRRDWDEARKFWTSDISDRIKEYLGGVEIVTLGEPFQSKPYPGWFVPYEIRLRDGKVRKHNLALRKDNPARRFVFDGGL